MDLPVALPQHLLGLGSFENENEMLQFLVKTPADLVVFFEKACSDIAWGLSHETIMSKILAWMSYQFLQGALAVEVAERVQKQVFENYDLLKDNLPKDIAIVCEGRRYPANSLMFGMSSPILLSYLRQECIEKNKNTLEVTEAPIDIVEAALEFIQSGKVENLWKRDWSYVLKTLRQASDWEMEEFVAYCARIYQRYIHRGNVISILKMAHKNGWYELKKACYEFFNNQQLGVVFRDIGSEELYMDFQRYSKEAMEAFDELHKVVTFLGFSHELIEDTSFTKIISNTPTLKGVNLQNTLKYSERLKGIPVDLEQIDLSMCEWLNEEKLSDIIETCPRLKVLKLNSNVQLDNHSWSQLHLLDNLEHLEISRCNQLSDDDFLIVIRGCPYLRTLAIEGCNKLTDESLVELSIAISGLVTVDFSRTGATDAVITELAYRNRQLRMLNLHRCSSISDHAIQEVVKLAPNLEYLDLSGSSISQDTKKKLLTINRHLTVN